MLLTQEVGMWDKKKVLLESPRQDQPHRQGDQHIGTSILVYTKAATGAHCANGNG